MTHNSVVTAEGRPADWVSLGVPAGPNSYRVKKPGDKGTRHDGPPTIILVNPPSGGITA